MADPVALMGERRGLYRILVEKSEGMRPLERPRRRWEDRRRREDNLKIDIQEVGWSDVDWIDLVLDRDKWRVLANTLMNRVAENVGNFLTS
jgi:hypothetical protein